MPANNPDCLFAAIADDYTGGADLAGMLFGEGVRTAQLFGLPEPSLLANLSGRVDAVVLCLKSRSVPAAEAQSLSLAALERLRALNPVQVYFKYCSTFDSTAQGNIGPVTEALMRQMDVPFTIAVPALPVNGRTQYLGHLFVNGQLLSESPLRHHPLNPMTGANLVRHLAQQTQLQAGLLSLPVVQAGAAAIRAEAARLTAEGVRIALVDAISDADLAQIAEAFVDAPLLTGGSGLPAQLPAVWRTRGLLSGAERLVPPPAHGPTLILSGSCSAATLEQLNVLAQSSCPIFPMDVPALLREPGCELARLTQLAREALKTHGLAAIRSSAPPGERSPAATSIEAAFAELARTLVPAAGVGRLIVAGGETSGAVVEALGVTAVEITRIVAPGVPELRTLGDPPLTLTLKSGNFGGPDFFLQAQHDTIWTSALSNISAK